MNVSAMLRVTQLMWIGSLFALLGLQRVFVEPLATLAATIVVFAVQVAPLLTIALLAVREGAKGLLWVCLVTLLYFTHGVWQWSDPATRTFGVFEVGFSLGAFANAWILLRVMPRDADKGRVKAP
jgi:uncharacterized membrane protein